MIITKTITTMITITKIQDLYSSNILDILMHELEFRFLNKCYKSCYITAINEIINHSDCTISTRDSNDATCSVQCIVSGVVIKQDELIHGLKAIRIDDSGIICIRDYIVVHIADMKHTQSIKAGQIISVRTLESAYPVAKENIVVSGSVFIRSTSQTSVYQLTEGTPPHYLPVVKKSMDVSDCEVANHFIKLIFDTDGKSTTKSTTVKHGVPFIIKYNAVSPQYISQSTKKGKLLITNPGDPVVMVTPSQLLEIITYEYDTKNRYISELCAIYPTKKDITDNANLWEFF